MSTDIYTLLEKHKHAPDYRPKKVVKVNLPDDFWDAPDPGEKTHWGAPTGETNIFYGGEIQRRAHAEGRHKHYKSEAGKKSWKNRCKKEARDKMNAGYQKVLATPEGMAMHVEKSKKAAQAAKVALATRIQYNGRLYLGWKELQDQTGISKYMFKKHNLGEII